MVRVLRLAAISVAAASLAAAGSLILGNALAAPLEATGVSPAAGSLSADGKLAANGLAAAQGLGGRYSEPIVVTGDAAALLEGAAADELWVWAWHDSGWHALPAQLDERLSGGTYVSNEDGEYDSNDELVFMADDLGDERPPGQWPPGHSREHPALEIRVTDPLLPGDTGFAYALRGLPDPVPETTRLVSFRRTDAAIVSASYRLGFAQASVDGFTGLKRLELFADETDLLDRAKLRARVGRFPLLLRVTEEDLADYGLDFAPDPVAEGPVRVVMDSDGLGVAYYGRATIAGDLSGIELPGGLTATELRLSLDLSPAAVGATYRDANVPEGVPVDGRPDSVPSAPVASWREVSFSVGRTVFLGVDAPSGSRAENYYKDDETEDRGDTGDNRSYADSGVEAPDIDSLVESGFPGQIVFLEPGSEIEATLLLEHMAHPLQVLVAALATPEQQITPTATVEPPPASSTPDATSTGSSGSATTTPESDHWRVFIPLAEAGGGQPDAAR